MKLCVVYEKALWSFIGTSVSKSGNSFSRAVKLTTSVDLDKYEYSGYVNIFDWRGSFKLGSGFGKNVILLGADMISSVNVSSTKEYILILGEDPMHGLDDSIFTAEKEYSINFTEQHMKLYLRLT